MTDPLDSVRAEIRNSLKECVGFGRETSFAMARDMSGLAPRTLYAISRGDAAKPETHLHALLGIPAFAERYMQARGYTCAHIGECESVTEWQVTAEIMEAVGHTGAFIEDGRYDHIERAKLAGRVLPPLIRKAVTFMHLFRRERAGTVQ